MPGVSPVDAGQRSSVGVLHLGVPVVADLTLDSRIRVRGGNQPTGSGHHCPDGEAEQNSLHLPGFTFSLSALHAGMRVRVRISPVVKLTRKLVVVAPTRDRLRKLLLLILCCLICCSLLISSTGGWHVTL